MKITGELRIEAGNGGEGVGGIKIDDTFDDDDVEGFTGWLGIKIAGLLADLADTEARIKAGTL